MKAVRYLVPLWIGVFLYVVFSVGFGAKGISAYNQLKSERERQAANMEVLTEIKGDLVNTRDSLYGDKENFALYARELGFAASGEHFIRIIGFGGSPKPMSSPGQVLSAGKQEHASEGILRIVSLTAAFITFAGMGVHDFLKFLKSRRRKPAVPA